MGRGRVGWHYHLRITAAERESMDVIARRLDVFRYPDGSPHDAEIARVLVISAANPDLSIRERAAMALRSSAVLLFSQELSQMLADLQRDLGLPGRRKIGLHGPMPKRRQPQPHPLPETVRPEDYRLHVHITADDALRTAVSDLALASSRKPTTVVRDLFEQGIGERSHIAVLSSYAKAVIRVRADLKTVASRGYATIKQALG